MVMMKKAIHILLLLLALAIFSMISLLSCILSFSTLPSCIICFKNGVTIYATEAKNGK